WHRTWRKLRCWSRCSGDKKHATCQREHWGAGKNQGKVGMTAKSRDRVIFSLLLLAGFLLLAAFITCFFARMAQPDYWHFMDIGSYLDRSFFAIDRGFFSEVPYWNYGYHNLPFAVYPPFFFAVNVLVFHAMSLFGAASVYWSFFATFLLSYAFAFAATWKLSRKSTLAYLLAAGNFFSVGLLVLMGFNTKIFAFNLCFPAVAYLLDRRKNLEFSNKSLAAFAVLFSVLFASQLFIFLLLCLLYLCILLQNRKSLLKGLAPLLLVPLLTFPYFASFVLSLGTTLSTTQLPPNVGLSLNMYTAILALFLLLFVAAREFFLAPFAALSALHILNLGNFIPLVGQLEAHSTTLFILGITCYYIVNHGFRINAKLPAALPQWLNRQNALFSLLFALLALNFFYFAPRIEKANLFNNPDYKPLLGFGELPSVFFVADMNGADKFIMSYVSYQTFKFHNLSVNDWFLSGSAHAAFEKDKEALLGAFRQNDCNTVRLMIEKMGLRTLVIKNMPATGACGLRLTADMGAFKVFNAD
ncbi:MAG: hypothetical protein NTW59_04800, partial [Candidatus Diapherotrites archaeon]|nr:hypothetical protein [Candidatus Diapherotrites archaeon]